MLKVTAGICVAMVAVVFGWSAGTVKAEDPPEGFKAMFNGKDLTGWEGNKDFWSVEDGAITGQATKEKPTKGNTFLLWKGGEPGDFELRIKFKLLAHNSGVQYRSKATADYVMSGYQADMDYGNSYTGYLYEERGRGILVKRGTKIVVQPDGKKETLAQTADEKDILKSIKKDDWNEYVIICQGNHVVQKLNGLTTVDLTDNQEGKRALSGLIGLQLHAGQPMKVQFKDIYLKELKTPASKEAPAAARGAGGAVK
jgi:hypothetical protein